MMMRTMHVGWMAMLALAFCGAGCGKGGIGGGVTCSYGGKSYSPGATFKDTEDCNTCHCGSDGFVACTLMYCLKDAGLAPSDGPSATPVVCSYGGATYRVGDSLKLECNTCQCISNGMMACTAMACVSDAAPPPPDVAVAPDAQDASPACAAPAVLTFGPNGGMVLYQDEYKLDPQTGMTITRTYSGRAVVDGGAVRTCMPPPLVCGSSMKNLLTDLAAAEASFKPGATTLYGGDPRPVDGTVYSITYGTRGTILVGSPCSSAASGTCVQIPTGVQRLATDLQSIAAAGVATTECKNLQ